MRSARSATTRGAPAQDLRQILGGLGQHPVQFEVRAVAGARLI